jgi:TolB-like protein/Flp pilus assembly protein TadD
VAEASHAVFLSYASQDSEAAHKICDALRAGGIEVFLDQSELRGGDAWDKKIRQEIHDCGLFIPIISQHSQERLEGYFRREWRLAIERAGDMAAQKAFLVPVVVDGTGDQEAFVPDEFRAVQWTRLPAGETPPEFVTRIRRLLSGESGPVPTMARRPAAVTSRRSSRVVPAVLAVMALATIAAYLLVEKPWVAKPTAPAAFAPPPHSIAVLPFVNMSGDKEQEYFSDGLTEELLNSLAEINELQVAARTSAFSFKGKDIDIGTIARKLNVGAVLEGSVRRSGNTVRVTTQVINAVTGFHLWSHTYDRDLGDVLKLETEIASAVASALKVSLLGEVATKIELGGTRNPAAFDAYLKGAKAYASPGAKEKQAAIDAYTEAVRLDPNYALAFAGRSRSYTVYATEFATGASTRESFDRAQGDARQALKLAPELAEGHLAFGLFLQSGALDFTQARVAFERALALAPGSADVLGTASRALVYVGQFDEGISAGRRAVVLDPLNRRSQNGLGYGLYYARRYAEAVMVLAASISVDPAFPATYGFRGLAYNGLGDFRSARSSCETKPDHWISQWCLAVVYDKLGRHAEAEAELLKLKAANGDDPYHYATIYAQWGARAKALEWLDAAMRLRDPALQTLKTDPLMDPLRKEPRFQAVQRELKFPQ